MYFVSALQTKKKINMTADEFELRSANGGGTHEPLPRTTVWTVTARLIYLAMLTNTLVVSPHTHTQSTHIYIQHTFYISPLHISPISLFRRYFTQDPQSLGLSRRRRKRWDFPWKYRILTETLGFHPKFAGISPKCLGICPKHAFRSITLLSIFGHFLYLAIFFPRTPPAKYKKCAV